LSQVSSLTRDGFGEGEFSRVHEDDGERAVRAGLDICLVAADHLGRLNGLVAPALHGMRFDRSFLAISTAAEGLAVALDATLLAERELTTGRLVRRLQEVLRIDEGWHYSVGVA
jgi:DNA-binding transcriptional LysR family regulator